MTKTQADPESSEQGFFDNPYWAPLARPLAAAGHIALLPTRRIWEKAIEGYQDSGLMGAYKNLFKDDYSEDGFITFIMPVAGAVLGLIGGAIIGGAIGYGAGLGAAFAAGAGGLVAGALAGPFVLAAALTVGAGIAGVALGAPVGFVEGLCKMAKHHFFDRPKQEAAVKANPPAATAVPQTDISGVYTLQELQSRFNIQVTLPGVLKQLEKLEPQERINILAALAEKSPAEFKAALKANSNDISVALDADTHIQAPSLRVPRL